MTEEVKRNEPGESPLQMVAGKEKRAAKGPVGRKGFADMTASDMVARYLESDDDKDGKLSSKTELAKMDERMQQRLATADANSDGFLERRELLTVAAATIQKMKSGRGGGGGRAEAAVRRGGGGGEGGPPGGGGPAGGG